MYKKIAAEIKKYLKMKWVVIGGAAALVIIALVASKTAGVEAEVYKVAKGDVEQYVEDTGRVLARNRQTAYVEGSGKVVGINVDVGQEVKKGDLLLSLDKAELELQLKDAEAKVDAAKAQLKGTELINYANKIDMAKAGVDQAQVAYDSAKRNYESSKSLFELEAVSKSEFERIQDEYKRAKAALDTANLQLKDLRQGTPEHVKSGYQSQLEQMLVHRDTILRSIEKQEVRAEIDGVVLEKLVENNSPVVPNTPAFVLGSTDKLELEADILADDINKVKVENPVIISGKAMGSTTLKGKVVKIAPAAKTVASTLGINQKRVTVNIEINEEASVLRPGYNVDIKIITAVEKDAVKVPDSSVFEYKGKSNVLVVSRGKSVLREVRKGIESGDTIEIKEGLKEGETIVAKPDNAIKEGARIKPVASGKKQ